MEGVAGVELVVRVEILVVVEVVVAIPPVEAAAVVEVGGAVVPEEIPTISPTALVSCCSEFLGFLLVCILVVCC